MTALWRAACLMGFLLVVRPAMAAGTPPLIAQMEISLRQAGALATLHRYFDCNRGVGWPLVASGDARAVRLAIALMPAWDACYGEAMNIALGQAMTRNPHLLLSYYDRFPKALPEWCVPGLIEPTDAEWRSALDKAQRAIATVKDERLRPARDICLGQILLYKSRLGR